MIRHIVFWKFREGTQAEAEAFLTQLQGLFGIIPELKAVCVRRSAVAGAEYDAALEADFDSLEALQRYLGDSRHRAVSALCKAIRTDRRSIDIEL